MGTVSIETCEDYGEERLEKALRQTFDNLGGIRRFITPGMKVVLKPNLVMKKRPEEAATTHPALVKVLTELLIEAGARVLLADSPGGLYTPGMLRGLYSYCGMEEACRSTGANLNYDTESVEVENPAGLLLKKVTVIKPLVEADLVINLPKLKTHGQMVYTGAVKNMFGAVPGALKAEYHLRMPDYKQFANALIDIFLSIKPGLTILDAITGMEGAGPTAGKPRHIGLLLAGVSAFEVDCAALKVVGISPAEVPVIREAIGRGLCGAESDVLMIKGKRPEEVRVENFDFPAVDRLSSIQFFERGPMKYAVSRLRPRPVFKHALCVGCADCARHCPAHIIRMTNGKPHADLTRCIRCFCCQELCPAKAISIHRPLFTRIVLGKK